MKLAFCFMIYDDINLKSLWEKFFQNIDPNKYNIYIHYKEDIDLGLFFNKYKLKRCVPTKWGDISLVRAQNLLYKEALKDTLNYKFINLSQSCIPIKSFDFIYKELIKDDNSYINMCPQKACFPRCNSLIEFIPREDVYKSHQWMILNREHTSLCVWNEGFISCFENISCPDEHFNVTLIKKRGDVSKLMKRATTFTNWDDEDSASPKNYVSIDDSELESMIESDLFFARKFDRKCLKLLEV